MTGRDVPRVLIVEDEQDISDLMVLHLKRSGYLYQAVESAEDALSLLEHDQGFQALLLDWMLPGMSGFDLCKQLRAGPKTARLPILMVTARAQTSDIVAGLEAGADDYLTKPFELSVFLARVRALCRRATEQDTTALSKLIAGRLSVDLDAYRAECDGRPLQLTKSEFKLLAALISSQGLVMTRDRLIEVVQGAGVSVVDRTIDTHIFGLRKKLGTCSEIIETVRGIGYRVRVD